MPPLKDATKRPPNVGEVISPATPFAQQVPPIIPREQPGLGPASLGPAPAPWTTDYDRVRQWSRPGTSQGRFPALPTKANPQTNASSRSVATKKVQPTHNLAQSTANQVQKNTAPPQNVTGLSVSKEVGKTLDGTLMQVVILSFTRPPAVDSNLVGTWDGVQVWQTGLTAGAEPVGVAGGTTSPLFINFPITGETITLFVESISATGIPSDAANVTNNPSITVVLNGATAAPPAPVIATSAGATNAGIAFSWNIVSDPATNFVSEYKVYKGLTSVFAAATCVDTITQPSNTTATTLTFNDVLAPGVHAFYWVSVVDTSGNESSPTSAGNGVSGSTTYRGAYSGGATYNPGDLVSSGGIIYICVAQTTGNAPPNVTFWGTSGASVFLGNWSNSTNYAIGNQVIDAAGGGGYYICSTANTNKQPSANSSFWQLVTAGNLNSYAGNWSNVTAYNAGQTVSFQGSLWVAISPGTNNSPSTTSSFWTLLGSNGAFMGAWNSGTAYTQNMTVAFQGNLYQAVQASTNQTPSPTSSTFWQLTGPATLDNLVDGPVYIRGIQYQSTTLVIPNGNFEASASLPVPGWTGSGATLSYDTVTPQSGNQSLKVTGISQFGGALSIQKWAVTPGDTYLVSGYVKSDGVGIPVIQLQFSDKNGASTGGVQVGGTTSTSWAFVSATGTVPVGTVTAILGLQNNAATQPSAVEFDQISALRLTTLGSEVKDGPSNFSATASGLVYRPLSNPVTGHDSGAGSATVNIAAFTMRTSSKGDISVNSGGVSALSYNTLYFVYYDDPTLAGGAVTYNVTTTRETAINGTGRFFVGSVTTPVQGAADTVGGNDGGNGTTSSKYAVQIFSAAGTYTWTKLSGAQQVEVLLVGAGGGGGSGMVNVSPANRAGGGGGAGGGVSRNIFAASFLNSTETLVVGAGGAGAAAQTVTGSNGNNGNNGADSTFGNYIRAGGGSGGGGGTPTGSVGGAGGVGNLGTGGSGGAGSSITFSGQVGVSSPSMGAGGGGGGGGATSGGTITAGGAGAIGSPIHNSTLTGGTAGTAGAGGGVHGGDGGSGTPPLVNEFIGGPGGGGGGGGATGGGVPGIGGTPSRYGGGGGGGGSTNGANSGVGGTGAPGIVIVTTYF